MKNLIKVLLVGTLLVLASCGGGGDGDTSSGGGAVSPEYIGTYKGTMIMNFTGITGSVSESLPVTVLISNDGRVDMAFEGSVSDASCSAVDANPIYLSGNSFSDSATLTCSTPELGTCAVTAAMNGAVANNAISGTGLFVYKCTVGNFTVNLSYTASKVITAQSYSSLSLGGIVFSTIGDASIRGIHELK